MNKFIGFQRKKGTFENDKGVALDYDNVNLFFAVTFTDEKGCYGSYPVTEKVKLSELEKVTGCADIDDLYSNIDKNACLAYRKSPSGSLILGSVVFCE